MKHALTMIGILASGSAFAMPTFQSLSQQALNNRIANRDAKPAPTECANFAGTWVGTCQTGDTKTKEETIVVTQTGCSQVNFGTYNATINSLVSFNQAAQTEKGDAYGANMGLVTEWNDKATELHSYFQALVKPIGGQTAHVKFDGRGIARVEGSKLLYDIELLGVKASCSYDKK